MCKGSCPEYSEMNKLRAAHAQQPEPDEENLFMRLQLRQDIAFTDI
jgi:hypothetical protein